MVGDGALDITVVGEEPRMAYDRVHLTEYFEHRDPNKLSMCDKKWFQEHKVGCTHEARGIERHACVLEACHHAVAIASHKAIIW